MNSSSIRIEDYREAADFIRNRISIQPKIGLVLGSGLGALADEVENPTILETATIPNLLTPVQIRAGPLWPGQICGPRNQSPLPLHNIVHRFSWYNTHRYLHGGVHVVAVDAYVAQGLLECPSILAITAGAGAYAGLIAPAPPLSICPGPRSRRRQG